jgi:adenylosuccinate lyase
MARWLENADFKTNVTNDPDISQHLSPAEIADCFDPSFFLRHIDTIMSRFGL